MFIARRDDLYSDLVVLRFKLISYLALTLLGAGSFNLIQGYCNDASKLLSYEGVWGSWDDKIQTDFLLELRGSQTSQRSI